MSFRLSVLGIAPWFFALRSLAADTVPSCDPQDISLEDLQPYTYKTYSIAESDVMGESAERQFFAMHQGNVHRDRFGTIFFEERSRNVREIPVNTRYALLEYDYCRKSTTDTRCVSFCTVSLTVLPGDHD